MKKILLLICLFCISTSISNATETAQLQQKQNNNIQVERQNRAIAFEKRLGLSDEQKVLAREIRIRGHQKLIPVVNQIMVKKQEMKMVKMSRIAVQIQEERLAVLDTELKVLEKQAHEIRKNNMKEFEAILTKNQKKILKQMKKEGRQKFHAEHPVGKPSTSSTSK